MPRLKNVFISISPFARSQTERFVLICFSRVCAYWFDETARRFLAGAFLSLFEWRLFDCSKPALFSILRRAQAASRFWFRLERIESFQRARAGGDKSSNPMFRLSRLPKAFFEKPGDFRQMNQIRRRFFPPFYHGKFIFIDESPPV
jgi:hypothetical protein